jgi:23S rRNA (guanine2445-N2)-methyltransferase / 23S rRNA (guanine2069-N7)-methyltransferase
MLDRYQFFVTCPKHLEGHLQAECATLNPAIAANIKVHQQGIAFEGPLEAAYRIILWSRIANRVLLKLAQCPAGDAEQLYQGVQQIDWLEHIQADQGIYIHFMGSNRAIRHSQFGAQKVKDAIVDQVRARAGSRPNIQMEASLHISIRLKKDRADIMLDFVGASLHQRGYRQQQGLAPLKENLAAAMLLKAGWPGIAASGGELIDPMCGSGTLLIEGALMAANMPPGLIHNQWSCQHWCQHDSALWHQLVDQAKQARADGIARLPRIQGWDINPNVIAKAKANAQRAGLSGYIEFHQGDFTSSQGSAPTGLIAINPPYGERLDNPIALRQLYRNLGHHLKQQFQGWAGVMITSDEELGFQTGLKAKSSHKVKNGTLDSLMLTFQFQAQPGSALDASAASLSSGAKMLANRLRKNLKKFKPWLKQAQTNAYRLYDADMPEYAVAIDRYADYVHIQEYAPPSSIDPKSAQKRLGEVMDAVIEVLAIGPERIALKQRKRQKGKQQYEKQDQRQQWLEVYEGPARYKVNLFDYLDTGLFLDHRPLRQQVRTLAANKRVLNLFAYTGSIGVQAALGGAKQLTQVDLSNTYSSWARDNLDLNQIPRDQYRLVTADCFKWLQNCDKQFDLIIMDPPSFSNSKKMETTLDIQRDHESLIREAMRCLTAEGVLIFSNNLRRFQLSDALQTDFKVSNQTQASIDKDFERSPKIHHCWHIRHLTQAVKAERL